MSESANIIIASAALVMSAVFSCALAALVLLRNPDKRTHRVFAVMSVNIALWALGVLGIIHCHTAESARLWVMLTFAVAAFLPATFYHFIACFPHQRFVGLRPVLLLLYAGAISVLGLVHSPWYIKEVVVSRGGAPQVEYGPVFLLYSVLVVLCMVFSFGNLAGKVRVATGVQRRQVEHVIIFIFASTGFASLTNILAPVLQIKTLELYGPCFMVLMMVGFAYSMIRYHLLDVWAVMSRTTVYAIVTTAVMLIFLGMVSVVHWTVAGRSRAGDLVTTGVAALLVSLVIQPLKERAQLLLDRVVLHRRYDADALMERVGKHCAQVVQVPKLLEQVAREIQHTIGVQAVRFLLFDKREEGVLRLAHSTLAPPGGPEHEEQRPLYQLFEIGGGPMVLEELQHARPTPARSRAVELLKQLDAFVLIPLKTKVSTVGVLALGEKTSRDIYTREDLRILSALAGPLATSIENTRLYSKLDEVNMHLERILSNMRGGVVAVDLEGKITTMNQEASLMLGALTPGQPLDSLEPRVAQLLRRTLKEHRNIRDYETIVRNVEGENMPVALASAYYASSDNQGGGAIVLIYNLSQLKRLESNVQRADRLTSIGTMAAGMAHEIKNPLQSIKTFSQLLPDRFHDPDFRRTFVEVVPPEVQRIDSIVSRLLDFARPKPVCFAPQNLRHTIHDVLALLDNQVRKNGIEIVLDFPEDIQEITADDQQLHQVFLNLFLNAIDAMKHAAHRVLHVRMYHDRTHLSRHMLPPILDVPCVKVVVADTGCGIPTESLKQIFTPFFTTKDYGTGLGLSVVHGIVTEHGGEIDVTSSPNCGATFCVTFPLVDRATLAERIGA